MAGQQIKDLPISTNVVDNDLIHIQEGGLIDKQITRQNLFKDLILPWSNTRSYLQNEIVASNGKLWQAVIANTGNTPETDNGTNWVASVKLDVVSKVIPYTINGTLLAGGSLNQLRDSGAFSMPLANSVPVDTLLKVSLPDLYSVQTPTISVSGGDLFESSTGTDVLINFVGSAVLTFTSDGVSKWKL